MKKENFSQVFTPFPTVERSYDRKFDTAKKTEAYERSVFLWLQPGEVWNR